LDLPNELPIRKKQRGKREPHVFYWSINLLPVI
jgi:hypothetical protein